ncbi:MAG: ParB/RepB/Spo0J family partition protein [Clostridia bacterium]|nr:ParB/RepB/Spo0J family partition protein [Clostridia bacterium]
MNGKNYESVFKNVGEPIDLFLIDDFPGHPYKVIDNSDMTELTESIKANGLLNPIILRKKADGRYELISGHRRKRAYEILKLKKINAVITDLNDDEAIIMMVDSNCQRSNILPSEKAFSYKMKLDAIKRQGKRTDLTLSQVGKKFNAYEELARSSGDSRNQVHRYIRLTYLVPELLEFVDNGRMKMQPAVELSYLDEEAQRDIVDIIDETDVFPSFSQTVRMRKIDKGELTYEKISEILSEDKPNQRPTYRISAEKISQLIPREYNDRQAEEYIIKALECYRKTLNRKMKKDKIA